MGISIWQLLIILLIIVLLFGTKKLRTIGKDMGGALKGFRDAMDKSDDDKQSNARQEELEHSEVNRVIEGEVTGEETAGTGKEKEKEKEKDKV